MLKKRRRKFESIENIQFPECREGSRLLKKLRIRVYSEHEFVVALLSLKICFFENILLRVLTF